MILSRAKTPNANPLSANKTIQGENMIGAKPPGFSDSICDIENETIYIGGFFFPETQFNQIC